MFRADRLAQHPLDLGIDIANARKDPLDLVRPHQLRLLAGDLLEVLDEVLVLLDRMERE